MGETDWGGNWVFFWWVGPCSVNLKSTFLLIGRAVFRPVVWNYGGGNEDNGDLLQKVPCTHCCTQCLWPCSRPPPTLASARDSWTCTGKSGSVSCGVTAPFSWVLVHTATAASRRLSWRGGRVWQQEPYFRPHSRSWCWRHVSSFMATPGHTWPHLTSWTKCLRLDALASNSLLKATEHSVPISGHCVPSLFAFCTQVLVPTPCPSSKWLLAPGLCPQRLESQHKPIPLATALLFANWHPQNWSSLGFGGKKRTLLRLDCWSFRHPGYVGSQFSLPHRWRRWGLDPNLRPHNLQVQSQILTQIWQGQRQICPTLTFTCTHCTCGFQTIPQEFKVQSRWF